MADKGSIKISTAELLMVLAGRLGRINANAMFWEDVKEAVASADEAWQALQVQLREKERRDGR